MSDNTQGKATAPYTSFSSLKTLVKNLKEHGLPSRVDRSVLGNSFSNAVGSQILTALKFLSLTGTDNEPTGDLENMVRTFGTEEWKGVLEVVLRKSYAPLFTLDLNSASPAQFNEKFRSAYSGTEDVQRKSMTFFLGATQDAGIKVSQYIMKNKKPRTGPAKKRAPKIARNDADDVGTGRRQDQIPPYILPRSDSVYDVLMKEIYDPNKMKSGSDEEKAVFVLARYLKMKEPPS